MSDRKVAPLSRNDKPHRILSALPQQPLQDLGLSSCRIAVPAKSLGEDQTVVCDIAIEVAHVFILWFYCEPCF